MQGAVQRALAGVSNNATAPATVRQGRRAGQPSGQQATVADGGGGEASFAFDLPNNKYGGAAGGGVGGGRGAAAGRRASEAWGEQQPAPRPQLAAPPILPAPLNECPGARRRSLQHSRRRRGRHRDPSHTGPSRPRLRVLPAETKALLLAAALQGWGERPEAAVWAVWEVAMCWTRRSARRGLGWAAQGAEAARSGSGGLVPCHLGSLPQGCNCRYLYKDP